MDEQAKASVVIQDNHCSHKCGKGCGPAGAVYGFGFIGALVYFLQHSPTFWIGVLGVLKAIAWPALVVYNLLVFLKL